MRFDVTSIDVNHGFGLYDPHGHLIGSVQAMPGYHNELDLTMSEGVYRIRCLEFCGLNHSPMETTFAVEGADGGRRDHTARRRAAPGRAAFTVEERPIERRIGILFAARASRSSR